jgi:hypothetical protein
MQTRLAAGDRRAASLPLAVAAATIVTWDGWTSST